MSSKSTLSSLKERAGPRVRFRAIDRVSFGSPVVLHLSNPIHELMIRTHPNTVRATLRDHGRRVAAE